LSSHEQGCHTTLYFETDFGDELRKTGFLKDGKHSQPQIVLVFLVSEGKNYKYILGARIKKRE
jgi:hypothetical protein